MSKTTLEEAIALAAKHNVWLWMADDERFKRLANLIDEARGVDAEPVGTVTITKGVGVFEKIQFQLIRGLPAGTHKIYSHPAPSQPAATVNLAVETPTQKGMRATLAAQGLSKAFDGLGAGRKERK